MLYEDYANEKDTQKSDNSDLYNKAGDYLNNKMNAGESGKAAGSSAAESASSTGNSVGSSAMGSGASAGVGAEAGAAGASSGAAGGAAAGAGTAAAGAATGGVALIVAAVVAVAKKGLNEVKSVGEKGTKESDYSLNPVTGFLIFFFILFLILFSTFTLKMTPGANENYKETSYSYTLDEDIRATIEKDFAEAELEGYDGDTPLKSGAEAYIYGVDANTGFQNALNDAITKKCDDIVRNLGKRTLERFFEKYDRKRSLRNFYNNPWPYDLSTKEHGIETYPRIGDVMNASWVGETYYPYTPLYNDVNYAEVLSVFSQNPDYNWKNCKFEAFNEYIRSDKNQLYYFEMDVKWFVVYIYEEHYTGEDGLPYTKTLEHDVACASEEEVGTQPETISVNGHEYTKDSYYCDVLVKPFGLRGLYMLAGVEAQDMHQDFYYQTNYDMLDYEEHMERTFLRSASDIVGPAYDEPRSENSTIYKDLVNEYGEAKGRSAWYYIEDPYNYNEISGTNPLPDYLKNLTEEERALIEKALINIDGGNLLQMMAYINQGMFPDSWRGDSGETIKQSGCMDCSIYMIYQYYYGISLSDDEIKNYSSKYVNNKGMFETNSFLSDHGLQQGSSTHGYNNFVDGVQKNIDAGQPLLLHIRGKWTNSTGNGDVYHSSSNGHFLVCVGYDKTGVYVNDPGNRANNKRVIPWEEWAYVDDLYYREITPS